LAAIVGKSSVAIFPTLLAGGWIWHAQMPVFEEFGLTVHAEPDAYVAIQSQPTIEGIEAYCRRFLNERQGPWILIGNSLGGFVSLRLAQEMGDQVLGVVVSGSPGIGEMTNLGIGTRAMLSPTYASSIRDKLFADPSRVSDELLTYALSHLKGPVTAKAGVRLLRSLRSIDVTDELKDVHCPVSMIWGAHDQVTPGARWRDAVADLPNYQFNEINDAGHSPMFETPDAFNGALRSFLTQVLKA
jgi:2-hydroxy-6-oxonona-2,4-dienedioate hydrolase